MSHDPSRKRFLARMLGLAAAGAAAPCADPGSGASVATNKEGGRAVSFRLAPRTCG